MYVWVTITSSLQWGPSEFRSHNMYKSPVSVICLHVATEKVVEWNKRPHKVIDFLTDWQASFVWVTLDEIKVTSTATILIYPKSSLRLTHNTLNNLLRCRSHCGHMARPTSKMQLFGVCNASVVPESMTNRVLIEVANPLIRNDNEFPSFFCFFFSQFAINFRVGYSRCWEPFRPNHLIRFTRTATHSKCRL